MTVDHGAIQRDADAALIAAITYAITYAITESGLEWATDRWATDASVSVVAEWPEQAAIADLVELAIQIAKTPDHEAE